MTTIAIIGASPGFGAAVARRFDEEGQSAYGQMLHDAVVDEGIHVGQLIIPREIAPGDATHDPDVLAGHLWDMHTHRGDFRRYADDLDA